MLHGETLLGEKSRNEASERVPQASPFPLCQRRLGRRQPEHHRHGSIELDSPRERGAGLFLLADRGLQRAKATQHLDLRDALCGDVPGLAPHPDALVVQRVQDGAVS
jgi:hypothetical protein